MPAEVEGANRGASDTGRVWHKWGQVRKAQANLSRAMHAFHAKRLLEALTVVSGAVGTHADVCFMAKRGNFAMVLATMSKVPFAKTQSIRSCGRTVWFDALEGTTRRSPSAPHATRRGMHAANHLRGLITLTLR